MIKLGMQESLCFFRSVHTAIEQQLRNQQRYAGSGGKLRRSHSIRLRKQPCLPGACTCEVYAAHSFSFSSSSLPDSKTMSL